MLYFKLEYVVFIVFFHFIRVNGQKCNYGHTLSDKELALLTVSAGLVFEVTAVDIVESTSDVDSRKSYNITANVSKPIKSAGKKSVKSITFGQATESKTRCFSRNEIINKKFLVFVKNLTSNNGDYFLSSQTSMLSSNRQASRQVKLYSCDDCGKNVTAKLPKFADVMEGESLTVRCKITGKPKPKVTWFKDGNLRTDKTGSQLKFKKIKLSDSGVYTCQAENLVSQSQVSVNLTVSYRQLVPKPTEPSSSSKDFKVLCKKKDYCLNGGTCFDVKSLGKRFCSCLAGFQGNRCQLKDEILPSIIEIKSRDDQHGSHNQHLVFIVCGIAGGAIILAAIFIFLFCIIRQCDKGKRTSGAKSAQPNGAPIDYIPVLPDGHRTIVPASELKQTGDVRPPLSRNDQSFSLDSKKDFNQSSLRYGQPRLSLTSDHRLSTTSERLAEHRNIIESENESTVPSVRNNSERRDPKARFSLANQSRSRLSAIAASPDFDLEEGGVSSSIAEEIQANSPPHCNSLSRERFSGSEDGLPGNLDSSRTELPVDMEVNFESEADVLGVDTSGDELEDRQSHGDFSDISIRTNDIGSQGDSSDSDESASSSAGRLLLENLDKYPFCNFNAFQSKSNGGNESCSIPMHEIISNQTAAGNAVECDQN